METKHVNLDSFLEIFNTQDKDIMSSFIKLMDNGYSYENQRGMSSKEIDGLALLSQKLKPFLNFSQMSGYFLGYVVSTGIREEFDILRFSPDHVLNIELKSTLPLEGMEGVKDQLVRHSALLSLLKKEVIACTYISDLNKIIFLNKDKELIEITEENLSKMVPENYLSQNELTTINLSQLIISPYSQPQEFSESRYFLTDEQKKVRKSILETKLSKINLVGGPGTGKTLLLLDLAKIYQQQGYNIVIIFCGKMDAYESISNEIGINIIPIRSMGIIDFEKIDIILVDEAQRLYESQYEILFELQNEKIIFSTDHQQTLHQKEKSLNIEGRLSKQPKVLTKRLKNKIRTDVPMASFILKFLDLKARKVQPYDYNKVRVVYFNSKEAASKYISNMFLLESYISIELTEYVTKTNRIIKRKNIFPFSESSHSVIGREYENVLVPLDKHFTYSEEGKLISTYSQYYPYSEESCIFEALTRVKNNLLLVVIDNPQLYITIQEILSWKNDKLYAK
ncbi:ATP-binding protein [Jeotgalicoccus sp. S0W5]|uniref:ATP-binding protein n=1 Tax=Jeotgalicoccus sp. S0W5 TaxID=2527874 RepID=UPI00196B44DF|nr:ATP-binding protein [Jeotgalicoccus sp. S0W5]